MMPKDKKGLGTGLDALFGTVEDDDVRELITVPVSKIEPRSEQPRDYFDEEALQNLAESIATHGLIQPVTVRRLSTGYYQIIAGERRWRASKLAGLKEIPVRVIDADDRRTAELALVENLQREDLNPMEEANGYRSLMNEYGLTQEDVSRSVGKSRPAVANSLRLLSLSAPVQEYVEKGRISSGHARALLGISDEAGQLRAADEILQKGYSVRKTEQYVAKLLKEKDEPEKPGGEGIVVDYANEVATELSKKLSRKVRLVEGRKGGRIELEYYGPDDREALIAMLMKLK